MSVTSVARGSPVDLDEMPVGQPVPAQPPLTSAGGEIRRTCLSGGLCLPHAPSPARPPPSTSPSSQWWASSLAGAAAVGSAARARGAGGGRGAPRHLPRGGRDLHARARRARPGSRRASSTRARTASGSAAGCWWCGSDAATRCSSSGGPTARPRSRSPTARGAGASVGVGLQLPPGRGGDAARRRRRCSSTPGARWEFPTFAAAARFVRRWAPQRDADGRRALRGLLPGGERAAAGGRQHLHARAARTASSPRRCAAPAGPRRASSCEGEVGGVVGRRDRPRRARHLVRPRRQREPRPARRACSAPSRRATRTRGRSRSRSTMAGRSSCGCAPRRAGTATSKLPHAAATVARRRGGPPRRAGLARRARAPHRSGGLARPDRSGQPAGAGRRGRRLAPAGPTERLGRPAARARGAAGRGRRRRRARAARPAWTSATSAQRRPSAWPSARGYRRTQELRDLLRAWSLRAGGGLREREDCRQRVTNWRRSAYFVTYHTICRSQRRMRWNS